MILAIDPGCTESAFVILDEDLRPMLFAKLPNDELLDELINDRFYYDHFAIEMVASYGMAVGKEVFETCVWLGRFIQAGGGAYFKYIYRKDEKMNLCHSMKANDASIKQALVDRFAYGVPNMGKGKKDSPGWFYGVSKDVWAAIAVGVTYHDLYLKGA